MKRDPCPYCLGEIADPAEAATIDADDALAEFISVTERSLIHRNCLENAASRR